MIGIDRDCKIHIIDFKTSRYQFAKTRGRNSTIARDFKSELDKLTVDDVKNNTPAARSVLNSIRKAANNKYGVELDVIDDEIVVIAEYSGFFYQANQNPGQKRISIRKLHESTNCLLDAYSSRAWFKCRSS